MPFICDFIKNGIVHSSGFYALFGEHVGPTSKKQIAQSCKWEWVSPKTCELSDTSSLSSDQRIPSFETPFVPRFFFKRAHAHAHERSYVYAWPNACIPIYNLWKAEKLRIQCRCVLRMFLHSRYSHTGDYSRSIYKSAHVLILSMLITNISPMKKISMSVGLLCSNDLDLPRSLSPIIIAPKA